MTATLFFYLLFFQVPGSGSNPSGQPAEAAKVTCDSETQTTDPHEVPDFPRVCKTSERVVVTATRAPLVVEESGVAANVFTAKDFEPVHGAFVPNLLRDVPGVSVVQSGGYGAITSVFARGGESDSALVLLDGVPVTEPGGGLDFAHLTSPGLQRMEVIRGPESVLFGAEASSAVIQMFTERGDPEARRPHGTLGYERGSYSTDHWTAGLNGGFADRLDYAFTSDQFRTTGEFPNSAFRITSGTANVGFRFSDATQLRAVFRTFDSYVGAPGQAAYGLTNFDANENARDAVVSVRLDDRRGTRFSQRALFGYHRYRDEFSDNVSENYDLAALVRTVPGPHPFVYFVREVPVSTTVPDPGTAIATYNFPLTAFPGLTVTDRTSASYQGTMTQRNGALVFGYDFERQAGIISATDVSRDNNGGYVHEQYALTPRIFLTGGARLEHSSTFGNEFAPRAAVTFRLPTDTYLRVSGGRGIKEPALIQNFANESFYVGNPRLKPEKTDSFEAGVSREWLGKRVRTELSYFRDRFADLIEFDFSVFPSTWRNIDQSWARGVELSGTARLMRFVTLNAGYTKLYTRITNDSSPEQIGLELLRRPRNSGSISLEYAPRRWTLIAGGRFVGERQDNDFVFGVNRNPAYNAVFAGGSFQATRNVELHVRVDNALNERYQEGLGYSALSRNAMGGLKLTW
ncbi:MAG TPA: TonB-dependent receptor [Bryobacteraceae bacterium]|jgi:vitamin B12 transporter|nr:TonB-dependent receptor [Bryobacteraceae bacterium]